MSDSLHRLVESVNDEETFLSFLIALARDREASVAAERKSPSSPYGPDAGGWENTTIETFLECASAWGTDTSGSELALQSSNPWNRAAKIVYAGKFYE